MIRKRPELDTVNPPGQITNPIPEALVYRPVHQGYPGDTEEAFAPQRTSLWRPRYLRDVIKRIQGEESA